MRSCVRIAVLRLVPMTLLMALHAHAAELDVPGAWAQVGKVLDQRDTEAAKQMRAASKQYPQLTASYAWLRAYTDYLHTRMQMARAPLAQHGMQWGDDWPIPGPPSADVCQINPLWCQCRGGNIDACIDMTKDPGDIGSPSGFNGEIVGIFHRVPTCETLKERYGKALQCDADYLKREKELEGKNSSLPVQEVRAWTKCRLAEDKQWRELLERGCVQPIRSVFPISP